MKEVKIDWVLVISIGLLIGLIIFGIITIKTATKVKDKACQEMGYEKFEYSGNEAFDFCNDSNGNLHYVIWEYNGKYISFVKNSVFMKEIKILE